MSRVRSFVSVLVLAIAALAGAVVVGGCAGLQPTSASPARAGALATAGQLAQAVSGQQLHVRRARPRGLLPSLWLNGTT